jgi:protein phosphatase
MKPAAHSHLPYAALSNKGLVREQNEDSIGITAFQKVSELTPPSLLCVLCDGVGGHQAGETASRLAVENITAFIEACDGSSPLVQLSSAIQEANTVLWHTSQPDAGLRGMATTAACAWIVGSRLFTATIGDSRVYLVRRAKAQQISTDHTWAQEALEAGQISREQVKEHPHAHVIKRYLGAETPPEVDTRLRLREFPDKNLQGMPLEGGDVLFLCSDGVSDLVKEEEIAEAIKKGDLEEALEGLKTLVYERGAHDNLSMIAVRIPHKAARASRWLKALRLALFALFMLAAALIGAYFGWLVLHTP